MATLLTQPNLSGYVQQLVSFTNHQAFYLVSAFSLLGEERYGEFHFVSA